MDTLDVHLLIPQEIVDGLAAIGKDAEALMGRDLREAILEGVLGIGENKNVPRRTLVVVNEIASRKHRVSVSAGMGATSLRWFHTMYADINEMRVTLSFLEWP
jgi:hypothetical protein